MMRPYHEKDYVQCQKIVNDVWKFQETFKPFQLADLFLDIYINSSLSESNYAVVIEDTGVVQGFLFGKSGDLPFFNNHYSGIIGKIKIFLKILLVKNVLLKEKIQYLRIFLQHEKNRNYAERHRDNEVHLFAVSPSTHGKGYGKILMEAFVNECKKNNVTRITLDTDKKCNYKFYDHFGYVKIAEFYSPLQELYSGDDGTSFVYELKMKQ